MGTTFENCIVDVIKPMKMEDTRTSHVFVCQARSPKVPKHASALQLDERYTFAAGHQFGTQPDTLRMFKLITYIDMSTLEAEKRSCKLSVEQIEALTSP